MDISEYPLLSADEEIGLAKMIRDGGENAKEAKGITVEKDHFYAQMLMVNSKVKAAEEFGKRFA